MTFNPEKHHRRSIRLKNYDYSQPGAYFVTLCTHKRQCWFGEIKNSQMYLNQIGKIVAHEWVHTAKIRPDFQLDEWIVMPNHLHGIIIITSTSKTNTLILGAGNGGARNGGAGNAGAGNAGAGNAGARNAPLRQQPNSLSSFIAGFKAAVTKKINLLRYNHDLPIWQRNYYESIVRDDKSLAAIREYIINNPACWTKDPEHQDNQHSQEFSLDLFF